MITGVTLNSCFKGESAGEQESITKEFMRLKSKSCCSSPCKAGTANEPTPPRFMSSVYLVIALALKTTVAVSTDLEKMS